MVWVVFISGDAYLNSKQGSWVIPLAGSPCHYHKEQPARLPTAASVPCSCDLTTRLASFGLDGTSICSVKSIMPRNYETFIRRPGSRAGALLKCDSRRASDNHASKEYGSSSCNRHDDWDRLNYVSPEIIRDSMETGWAGSLQSGMDWDILGLFLRTFWIETSNRIR